eukprot:1391601-Pyramimonas_sp.AAC.1
MPPSSSAVGGAAVDAGVTWAARAPHRANIFFTRALLPRDAPPAIPPPAQGKVWRFARGGEVAMLTVGFYTGGSSELSPIGWPEANRAGHQQSVPRAELFAVILVLRRGTLPLHMRAGCVGAVDGVKKGVDWCAHPRRPNCDFLGQLWQALQGQGGRRRSWKSPSPPSRQTIGEATLD